MICYQDEKTYGPGVSTMSKEQLAEEIKKLETEIYGEAKSHDNDMVGLKQRVIYDVEQKKYVEAKGVR